MTTLRFDHPDVRTVLEAVFNDLVGESDRGAVLMASELIDKTLAKLLQDFFPHDFKANGFLKYPGPLHSAGARADASYAFRLIRKNVYQAITILRRIRNVAAHSPSSFSLEAHTDRLREAYEATVTPGDAVNHFGRQFMAVRLTEVLRNVDSQLGDQDRTYSDEEIDEILERPEIIQHLPKYRLAVAVSLICAIIVHHKNQLLGGLQEGALMTGILQPQERFLGGDTGSSNETAPNPADQADS